MVNKRRLDLLISILYDKISSFSSPTLISCTYLQTFGRMLFLGLRLASSVQRILNYVSFRLWLDALRTRRCLEVVCVIGLLKSGLLGHSTAEFRRVVTLFVKCVYLHLLSYRIFKAF